MYLLEIDRQRCVGHGKCYLTAPDLFAPDDDDDWGRAVVLRPHIDDADGPSVATAGGALIVCPEDAISLVSTTAGGTDDVARSSGPEQSPSAVPPLTAAHPRLPTDERSVR